MENAQEVTKHLDKLHDLRDAIKHIKESESLNKILGMSTPVSPIEGDKPAVANIDIEKNAELEKKAPAAGPSTEAQPNKTGPSMKLQHLGMKSTSSGMKTHMIGVRGANQPHYEMHVDIASMKYKQPHVTLTHVSPEGSVIDKSPSLHLDVKDATKAMIQHNQTGNWASEEAPATAPEKLASSEKNFFKILQNFNNVQKELEQLRKMENPRQRLAAYLGGMNKTLAAAEPKIVIGPDTLSEPIIQNRVTTSAPRIVQSPNIFNTRKAAPGMGETSYDSDKYMQRETIKGFLNKLRGKK